MNVGLEIALAFLALFYYMVESLVLMLTPRSWRMKDVSGDVVLVTGGGNGIGRQLAVRFAGMGCKVVIWDVNKEGNNETAKLIQEKGGKVYAYECDLSDKNAIYRTAEKVKIEVGNVSILINNAGVVTGKPLLDCPDHMIQRTFDVNILAHFWTVKAFLPAMLEQDRGHIVTIASLGGLFGINNLADYCSSKFAAVGFDETLKMELQLQGRENIHTTVVCPYYVNTNMFHGVKSKLFPILNLEKVADGIVSGVLVNEHMVVIPSFCYMLVVLKLIIPWKAYLRAYDRCGGISSSMYTFRGWARRVTKDQSVKSEHLTHN